MKHGSIVISGQPGAGSTTFARLVAERLGFKWFSPGQLFKDLSKGDISDKYYFPLFDGLCKTRNIDLSRVLKKDSLVSFWGTEIGKSAELHNAIDELQIKLAEEGGVVFDGKLSIRKIPLASFKVWFRADMVKRAARISSREGLSLEKSISYLKEREDKERAEWKKIYGFDYFDQESEADLVVDTSKLDKDQIFDLIISRVMENGLSP
jgi:CMP/dCMP kinase